MKKMLLSLGLIVVAAFAVGCAATDVVLKHSPESLSAIIKAFPNLVADQTNEEHVYVLSVDGETALKISHDYDRTANEDLVLSTPVAPFVSAGLVVKKLPSEYRVDGDALLLVSDYGKGTGMKETVTESLFESVTADRTKLSYHQALDHFGIALSRGKVEWAKDYTKNDKDIVFVLAAKPLADIGVDVQHIEGWIFKTMPDENGNNVDVLLKPYDLK